MKHLKMILPGITLLALVACKKDADIAPELRPSEFWVRCTLENERGESSPFEYRGEQTYYLHPDYPFPIRYFSTEERDRKSVV